MEYLIGSECLMSSLHFLNFREVVFKVAAVSKTDRKFVQNKLKQIQLERTMVLSFSESDTKPMPKHKMWITRVANCLTLAIHKKLKFSLFLLVMKQFRPNLLRVNLELTDFTDEDSDHEKVVQFLAHYKIGNLNLNCSVLRLKASATNLIC